MDDQLEAVIRVDLTRDEDTYTPLSILSADGGRTTRQLFHHNLSGSKDEAIAACRRLAGQADVRYSGPTS